MYNVTHTLVTGILVTRKTINTKSLETLRCISEKCLLVHKCAHQKLHREYEENIQSKVNKNSMQTQRSYPPFIINRYKWLIKAFWFGGALRYLPISVTWTASIQIKRSPNKQTFDADVGLCTACV